MSGRAPAPQAGVARYRQVKDYVVRLIRSGRYAPGARLPSEHELVARFGVSRMTANRALRELADLGRIVRVAGVGTFVAEPRPQSTLLQIANLAAEVRGRGHDYRCEVVEVLRVAAPPEVAEALALKPGAPAFHAVCVHRENGVPVQLEERWVNPRVAPQFGRQDFTKRQPSEYLVSTVPYDEIEHVVDAVLPSAAQAARLEMPASQPCLLLTRRTWTNGVPVTLVRCLHPASRYRLGSRYRAEGHSAQS